MAAAWQRFVEKLNCLGPDEEAGRPGDFTTRPLRSALEHPVASWPRF